MFTPVQPQISSVVAQVAAAAAAVALFKPGQVLEALVLGKTPDGLVALKIGDIVVNAQLPQTFPPGTTLHLQVRAGGPAPQLAMVGTPQLPAQQVPVAPVPALPLAPVPSAPLPPAPVVLMAAGAAAPPQMPTVSALQTTLPTASQPGTQAASPVVVAPPAATPAPAAARAPARVTGSATPVRTQAAASPAPVAVPPPGAAPAQPAPIAIAPRPVIVESPQQLAQPNAPVASTPTTAAPRLPSAPPSAPAAQPPGQPTGSAPSATMTVPAPPSLAAPPVAATSPTISAPAPAPSRGTLPATSTPNPAPLVSTPASHAAGPAPTTIPPQPVTPAPQSVVPPPPLAPQQPAPLPQTAIPAVAAPVVPPTSPPPATVPAAPVAATLPQAASPAPTVATVAVAPPVPAALPEPASPSPLLVAQGAPRPAVSVADLPRPTPLPATAVSAPAATPPQPTTPAAALAQMVPEALARQNTIAPLLASLAAIVAKPGALPEPVLRAALQVLGQRVQLPPSGPTAPTIAAAIAKSGVYLEATLAKGMPAADLKSGLVTLKGALATWLGGNPAPVTPAQQAAPPLRGMPPRAEAIDLPPLPDTPREAARALHSQADAALSRVKLMQLAALPDADPTRPVTPELRMEVPFLLGQQLVLAQFQIFRDGARHKPDAKRGWTMRFAMNLPAAGEIGAEIGLLGRSVNVALWAADPDTSARLEAALPELAPALSALGLEPGAVRVRSLPPEAPRPASGQYLDSRR